MASSFQLINFNFRTKKKFVKNNQRRQKYGIILIVTRVGERSPSISFSIIPFLIQPTLVAIGGIRGRPGACNALD